MKIKDSLFYSSTVQPFYYYLHVLCSVGLLKKEMCIEENTQRDLNNALLECLHEPDYI